MLIFFYKRSCKLPQKPFNDKSFMLCCTEKINDLPASTVHILQSDFLACAWTTSKPHSLTIFKPQELCLAVVFVFIIIVKWKTS